MSLEKGPKPRKKLDKNDQRFCHEAQNVGAKHKDNVEDGGVLHQAKRSPNSIDRKNNNTVKPAKKKEFVIPRKKKQAKELLQTHRFDSRETKELLRSVQLSLRDPNFWVKYKFERVELVNNEKLARKYGEKKQALRLETQRTNRELEDKFAFLYTTSRTEAKSICEHGLPTGHSSLKSLGDPKLGVYLCRFADIIYKRPLTADDSGYLLVFRVVKGKVRFIGGSNPELQPTPHHDCHVSKSQVTTLSSKASHSDVFESSQFYFYEIDENSDDFHVKHPRQVLPYAVLTFTIVKPEQQQAKPESKPEGKKAVVTGNDFPSSAEENNLSSPNRTESKDDVISSAQVSWSGGLAINKKPFAYIELLSYSRKKHPLPIYMDHVNISQKISHDDLRSLLKCPVFKNGKPASSGVCIELSNGRKFIYYEVRAVSQVQEKFGDLISHFLDTKMAGVIEYFNGAIYLYLIPTSKLTHDVGITDRKSPLALHALVQVRHTRRLPNTQEPNEETKEEDVGVDDSSLNEAVIRSQVQEIFKKKYDNKTSHGKTKQKKIPSLMNKRISLRDVEKGSDKLASRSKVRRNSSDVRLPLLHEGASHEERLKYQKDAQKLVDQFFNSVSKEKDSRKNTLTKKGTHPNTVDSDCSLSSQAVSSNNKDLNTDQIAKDEQTSRVGVDAVNRDVARNDEQGCPPTCVNSTTSFDLQSQNLKNSIDFLSVQKLIKEFQEYDKHGSGAVPARSSGPVDPRLQRRSSSSSSQDVKHDKSSGGSSFMPPLSPPPLPPPPPPPVSPFSISASSSSTKENKSSLNGPSSSATDVPSMSLVTSPVSPPSVKRQEMTIPGLEPPGSPAFQLMREKVSFLNQSICTSATYLKDRIISTQSVTTWNERHPASPLMHSSSGQNTPLSTSGSHTRSHLSLNDNKATSTRLLSSKDKSPKAAVTSPFVDDNSHSSSESAAQTNMLKLDIPDYSNVVITRPLTNAEKKSSLAIKKINNILFQNRDSLKKTPSEDENTTGFNHITDYKSQQPVAKLLLDQNSTNLTTPEKQSLQSEPSYQSPDTPQLKNGLDLLDNLISPLSMPESRSQGNDARGSSESTKKSKDRSRETTPRKETCDAKRKKVLPSRKRKVTIKKNNTTVNENGWDDITSDISDTELPVDCNNTTDGYTKENHRKESMYRDQPSSPRSRDNSRPSSRDGAETNPHYHDKYSKERTSPRRKVSLEPVRDRSIDTQEVSRHTGRSYRNDPDGHPDDWDREWKRRKLDNDQEPLLPDDDSNYSDSPMSISPLNSPVSFEYAVPNDESYKNRYRFVRTSPEDGGSLEVTITRDIECNDNILSNVDRGDIAVKPYHSHEHPMIPSSPTEVDVPGNSATPYSPGTPETAVPGVDFLHASIGYWSSGVTTTEPVDRQSVNILPKEIGDKKFQSTQQDNIQDVTYRSKRDPWSSPSSPYCDGDDHEDHVDCVISAQFQHEEPLVMKPRGEGYSQRGPSSFGESSGYDYEASCYDDRNLNNSPDYYTPVDRDGDPYGMSSHNELYTDQVYPDRYPQTYDDQRDRELYYTCRSPYENVDSPRSLESIDMEELGSGNRYYTSDQLEEYSMSERRGSPLQISDHPSYYSPDEQDVIDDDFLRRTAYSNDGTSRRGIIAEDYGRRSPLGADDRPLYSPGRRGITDDDYGRRSPLTGDDRPLYSPGRRGITDNDYGRRSPLTNNEYRRRRSVNDDDDRPSCSPSRRGITVNDYGGRSPSPNDERAQYSPGQLGINDDDYGRRTSPSDDERAPYSPSRGGINKDYGRSSPLEIQVRDSQYSPDRRPVTDNKYGECYRISGGRNNTTRGSRICKYRQDLDDYQNLKQDFTSSVGDERDCRFVEYKRDVDIYQDEERLDYLEDEDDVRDHQPCKYTIDTVEQNYDSEGDDVGCDSMGTPEHYDIEQHKYLDNIVENNISATTLELDRAVFDGIRNFPGQLMELARYLKNIPRKSSDDVELVCSDSSAANSSGSRDPRLNQDSRLHDSGFVSEETLRKQENAQRSVGSVENEGEPLEGATQKDGKVTPCKNDADRTVEGIKRRKNCGEHKRVIRQLPKKLSYFYVYNPDNDPECEAVKHYMLKTGAHFLNVSDKNNLRTMTGELRILVRRKHRPSIHRISNLDKLKLHGAVKFALFNTVDDVSKKTRAYAAIFQYGGVLIPDDVILRTVDPVYLEALLSFIAEQNSIHQKVFWVMNIRYIAYKKLGSQRPLTWRDTYVLDLLRKYRNEGFVNIINKDYVVENLSSVQKYLNTALKQQLELMPTYRHFILLSDLNKQTLEVSWFLNRGIGFMNVKECLHVFAGEAKMQQLLSASKYTNEASDYTLEGTRQDIMQYDTIDSPEDEESTTSVPSSTSPATPTQTPTQILKTSHEEQCINNHFSRSMSCNMVSRSSNYKNDSSIKEKRLEILSSINNVKTNLINNIQVNGNQGDVAKQRQYDRSRSYEPRLRVHNERVTPRKPDDLRAQESTRFLDKNGLQGFKEAQHLKPLYDKGSSHHGNDRHYGYKETLSSSKLKSFRERNSNRVENGDDRKSSVKRHSALDIDKRAH